MKTVLVFSVEALRLVFLPENTNCTCITIVHVLIARVSHAHDIIVIALPVEPLSGVG